MFCKKCGYNLKENEKVCPFCNTSIDEEIDTKISFAFSKNKINKEEKIQEDVYQQKYVNINDTPKMDEIRNHLGYINLKTTYWHHIILAVAGYFGMNMLFQIIGSIIVGIYIGMGYDFSCISAETQLELCPIEIQQVYSKISCIGQVICELAIVAITLFIFRKHLKSFFSELKDSNSFKWFFNGFLLMYGLTFVYSIMLKLLNLESSSTNQDLVNQTILANPALGFIFVVIAAPLFEEVIFRLGVFRSFTTGSKKREIIGLIVTTILFAMIHMSATFETVFADINNPDWEVFKTDLLSLPSYLIGAFCLTFAYYKSKNFVTPIMMHMAWNFMAYIGIISQGLLPEETPEVIINLLNCLTGLF